MQPKINKTSTKPLALKHWSSTVGFISSGLLVLLILGLLLPVVKKQSSALTTSPIDINPSIAIGIMIIVGVSWIPGGIVVNLFRAYKETLGGLPPVYHDSYSVFTEGPRIAIRRLAGQIFRHDYCTGLTVCCAIMILVGDILCFLDLHLLLMPIVVGTVLSSGGFFVISLRVFVDNTRERRLMRQIF